MSKNKDRPNECWVDGVKNVSDFHHIIPVQFGGPEDGKTVPLCPTCHRHVHREGEGFVKNGVWGKFVNPVNYPNPEHLKKAEILAKYIAESMSRFIASGKSKADDSRNMIQVSLSVDELALTHDLKRSLGIRSLERLIKTLIFEKWQELQRK